MLFMHEVYTRFLKIATIHNIHAIKYYSNLTHTPKNSSLEKSRNLMQKIVILFKENNNQKILNYIKSIKEIGMKNKYV